MITSCMQSVTQTANSFVTFVTFSTRYSNFHFFSILFISVNYVFLGKLTNFRKVTCNGLAVEILPADSGYISTSSYEPVVPKASL